MFVLFLNFPGAKRLCAGYQMDKTHGTVLGDKSSLLQQMGSNNSGREPCIWSSSEGGCTIDIGKQIFCNRSLNMKNIVAVGFDMDYTLAQYKPETFETLAYEGTIRKLVNNLGYPAEVRLVLPTLALLCFSSKEELLILLLLCITNNIN